ncbi:MAG: Phosphoglucomutase [Chlamydiae bacterium]|nr:Phosphoglucomutase [Chlamydiota bacterium]
MSEDPILDKANQWLSGPIDQESKHEILELMKSPDELRDAFYKNLSFGTGGMRGIMGAGTNRINRYTIQMATQGLANYLLKHPPLRERHAVFIGYDSRHNSKEYAWEAARVLAGNGITAYLTCELRPSPFISFGVRNKKCSAGIMITASHNPKEYNGYKVYWSDGAQVVPPHDNGIVKEVEKIESLNDVRLSLENSPLIEIIDPELDFEYLDAIHKLQFDPKEDEQVGDQLKITYSSLHGTGIKLLPRALKSWGFSNINLVDHQSVPDGSFPTIKTPNPENPEALAMGIQQMVDTQSDLFIATDPDADRMGVVVLHKEKPFILTGNQIAAVCLEYICQILTQQERLPEKGAVISTIVSTDLLEVICKHYNLAYFDVLTGFKYIGELIHKWETEQSPYTFLFGAEESYGYLIGTHCRDKDATVISCLIAEAALLMNVEGRTLVDFLVEIYKKYGLFFEAQKTLDFPPGKKGMDQMNAMMDKLRKNSPQKIAGVPVEVFEDYQTSQRVNLLSKAVEPISLPSSNVLLFRLKDQSKIVVRPSGTEPKLKIYIGVYEPTFSELDSGLKTCQDKIDTLLHATESLLH